MFMLAQSCATDFFFNMATCTPLAGDSPPAESQSKDLGLLYIYTQFHSTVVLLANTCAGNKTTYSAGLGCNSLMVKTKACDLPTALEFLVVLTTWKHKALQYTQPGCFVDAEEMQKALNDSAKEHGISVAAMGLRFHAELANEFWFGRARHAWSPVVHTVHDICDINNMFCKYRTGGCRGFLPTRGPVQLQKSWEEFQEQYAEMWRKASGMMNWFAQGLLICSFFVPKNVLLQQSLVVMFLLDGSWLAVFWQGWKKFHPQTDSVAAKI